MTRSLERRLRPFTEERQRDLDAFQQVDWREILAFHCVWSKAPLNMPYRVRDRWHVSTATYWQRLLDIIDLPDALEAYPETVRVMRRRRDSEREWQARVFQQSKSKRRTVRGHGGYV